MHRAPYNTAVPLTITATRRASNTTISTTHSSQPVTARPSPYKRHPHSGARSIFPETDLPSEVTYSEHIAQILQKQCQTCHRQGEVAPFTLTDYSDAKAWATEIAEYTQARLMPPWKPAPGYGRLQERTSPYRYRNRDDCALGRIWRTCWRPWMPYHLLPNSTTIGHSVNPIGSLRCRSNTKSNPKARTNIGNLSSLRTLRPTCTSKPLMLQPGNRKTVHHVIAYLDTKGEARKLDAEDPKPGYVTEGTGPGFDSAWHRWGLGTRTYACCVA